MSNSIRSSESGKSHIISTESLPGTMARNKSHILGTMPYNLDGDLTLLTKKICVGDDSFLKCLNSYDTRTMTDNVIPISFKSIICVIFILKNGTVFMQPTTICGSIDSNF
jgi:hypothetical protein